MAEGGPGTTRTTALVVLPASLEEKTLEESYKVAVKSGGGTELA